MAFMNQEKKKALTPAIKATLKKYGMKGSISVRNYSEIIVTIKSGPLFETLPCDRTYAQESAKIHSDFYQGKDKEFLEELGEAMMQGNHDRSDSMTDYFDVGWYASIHIGQWNKPFQHTT